MHPSLEAWREGEERRGGRAAAVARECESRMGQFVLDKSVGRPTRRPKEARAIRPGPTDPADQIAFVHVRREYDPRKKWGRVEDRLLAYGEQLRDNLASIRLHDEFQDRIMRSPFLKV